MGPTDRAAVRFRCARRRRRRRKILNEDAQTRKFGLKNELPGARTISREFSRKIEFSQKIEHFTALAQI